MDAKKQMFSITCPVALFMEYIPGPPEHEKKYVDGSRSGRMGMHYVTSRSHRDENP
jgi:hypothetical protein